MITTTAEADPMQRSEEAAEVDPLEVQALITEALGATGSLPAGSRLAELDEYLRAEIGREQSLAQRLADRTPTGSREWHALQTAIENAEDAVSFQMGSGPLAGAIHVSELARRLCELRQVQGPAQGAS